jgi:hypothetical protein
VQQLVPGASVAASDSTGSVPVGAIGTVTYRNGATVYAFGHELDAAGRRSLLLQDAYVYYVVANPLIGSYKLAVPGHIVGTLTSDTPGGVVGIVGAPPRTIPVTVTAHDLDTGNALTLSSFVADETDVGLPLGTSLVDVVAPMQVAQAASEVYNGAPANESGHMCFTVRLREIRAPLRFCNRYVGTTTSGGYGQLPPELALATSGDVTSALGLLDHERFAALHVTSIDAQVYADRGLDEATIVRANAQPRVNAGQRVVVHLLVRLYRGPLRRLSFTVRIPRSAKKGLLLATLSGGGSPAGSAQDFASALAQIFGAGTGPVPGSQSGSLVALRHRFVGIGRYDGLQIKFGRRMPSDAYRNPSLLIKGHTLLPFIVG